MKYLLLLIFSASVAIAASIPGTVVFNPITLGSTDATNKHIGNTSEMKGTPKQVLNNTERDAIPAARRTEGMEVYVVGTSNLFRLQGGILNANWSQVLEGSGITNGLTVWGLSLAGPSTNLSATAGRIAAYDSNKVLTNVGTIDIIMFGAVGDDSTINTASLQAALDSNPVEIYIPSGIFRTGTLTVPTNVTRIFGPGTLAQSSVGSDLLFISGSPGLIIEGVSFRGVSGAGITASQNNAVKATNCSNLFISRCTVTGFRFNAFYLLACYDFSITGNLVYGISDSGVRLLGCHRGTVADNVIRDTQLGAATFTIAVALETAWGHSLGICSDININGNKVLNYPNAQGIMGHSGQRITVSGNIVSNVSMGISFNPFSGAGSNDVVSDITIVGNVAVGTLLTGSVQSAYGIFIGGGPSSIITNTIVANNVIRHGNANERTPAQGGIGIGYAQNIAIVNNAIHDSYVTGIAINNTAQDIIIALNTIHTVTTAVQGNGISVDAGATNVTGRISDNIINTVDVGFRLGTTNLGLEIRNNKFTAVSVPVTDYNAAQFNVSIGAEGAAPNNLLTLNKNSGANIIQFNSSGLNAYLGMSSVADDPIVGMTAGDFGIRVNANDLFISSDSGSSGQLVVKSNGNVGIGNTAPATSLHISNSVTTTRPFRVDAGTNQNAIVVHTNGNIGIGTENPGQLLTLNKVSGLNAISFIIGEVTKSYFGISSAAHDPIVGMSAGDIGIRVANNDIFLSADNGSSGQLVIKTSGNVGIKTDSPTNSLDVAGHTSLRSNLWAFNLGTNGTVVSLLGRDANSKIVETAIPVGAGDGGIATNAGTGFDNTLTNTTLRGVVKVLTNSAGVVALAISTNNARTALDIIGAVTINPTYDAQSADPPIIPFLLDANVPGWLQSNRLIDARTNGVSVFAVTPEGKTYQRGISIGVGTNLVVLTNMLYASAALDFPSTLAQTDSDLAITVTGAKTGDLVTVGGPIPLTGSIFSGFASNDTVFVRCSVYGITAKDPASATFKVKVEQFQ